MRTVETHSGPDGVRLVTLRRPEARNALRRAEFTALIDAFTGAEADGAVRVVLLAAEGLTFCAGGDLKETGEIGSQSLDDHPVHAFAELLAGFGKPLVAAVHGPAVGFGFTMLAHFDVVVAGPEATFAAPFARLGVPTEAGSSYLLPALAGARVASRLLLLGEKLDAAAALACGLVSHLVDGDREAVLAAATGHAERLAGFRPDAVRANRELLRAAHRDLVTAAAARERAALAEQLRALRDG
jgi:enoyl-CoA hydratase/carnithine racemase